jgi:hypothetical protein
VVGHGYKIWGQIWHQKCCPQETIWGGPEVKTCYCETCYHPAVDISRFFFYKKFHKGNPLIFLVLDDLFIWICNLLNFFHPDIWKR